MISPDSKPPEVYVDLLIEVRNEIEDLKATLMAQNPVAPFFVTHYAQIQAKYLAAVEFEALVARRLHDYETLFTPRKD
jgi:hypothetical protein